MLVLAQFKEITVPLASCLARSFGSEGLVLTGDTAVAKRKELARRFQEDEPIPSDSRPELRFLLQGVDQQELIAHPNRAFRS